MLLTAESCSNILKVINILRQQSQLFNPIEFLDIRNFAGHRNKKIASPAKPISTKCSNNIINQQTKSGHKVKDRNGSLGNNDSLMIDDCGAVDESSEKSVGFVQEWINTYVFLSREFFCFPFAITFRY